MKTQKHIAIVGILAIFIITVTACDNGTNPTHTHDWGAWTQTIASNCTTAGEETRTCTIDPTHTESRAIAVDPTAHNWQPAPSATAPTCTEDGHGDQICAYNAAHTQSGTIPKLGHDYQNYSQTTAPTCTTAGVETATCTHDATHTTTRTGAAALGHDYQNYSQTTPPTCTTEGVETGICTRDTTHTTTRSVTALGHNYQWVVTAPTTCTTAGVDTGTCTRDQVTATRAVAALGHDYQNWTQTTVPTCTTEGVETGTCTHDATHTTTRSVTALGHDYQWTTTTPATCTTAGVDTGTCIRDTTHTTTRAVAINPNAHDWETTTTAATETTDGIEGKVCRHDSSHIEGTILYATGTAGLAYELIDNNTAYRVRKGTVTSGEVHIPAYHINSTTDEYLPVTEIGSTIVSSISDGAFYNTTITVVTIAENSPLESIGGFAFANCTSLTAITIPVGVTSIGNGVFYVCRSLTAITIPEGVTSIGGDAFNGCDSLTAITVDADNSMYASQGGILYNKAKTTLIKAPGGISGNVTIPEGVTSINESAFAGCRNLTAVIIPASVTAIIGNHTFSDSDNLTAITVNAGNSMYASQDGILYNKAKTTLIRAPQGISDNVTIPTGVAEIGILAFYRCSLTAVTIPASVTAINIWAFSQCSSLTSVTFEGTITSSSFNTSDPFDGDLRAKFYATDAINGTLGTYTRPSGSNTWTLQP